MIQLKNPVILDDLDHEIIRRTIQGHDGAQIAMNLTYSTVKYRRIKWMNLLKAKNLVNAAALWVARQQISMS